MKMCLVAFVVVRCVQDLFENGFDYVQHLTVILKVRHHGHCFDHQVDNFSLLFYVESISFGFVRRLWGRRHRFVTTILILFKLFLDEALVVDGPVCRLFEYFCDIAFARTTSHRQFSRLIR